PYGHILSGRIRHIASDRNEVYTTLELLTFQQLEAMVRLKSTFLLFLFGAVVLAQTALTNDAVTKMLKAGLGEDIVLSTIKSQPAKYTTAPDGLIALKGAGVSDKIIAAMVERMSAPAMAAAPAP